MLDQTNRHQKIIELDQKSNYGQHSILFRDEYIDLNSLEVDLDEPIYRIFSNKRFQQTLKINELVLVRPEQWQDPFENILLQCVLKLKDGSLVSLSELRRKFFGQCWTFRQECDGLWRNYKSRRIAIKVKSTPRKIMSALYDLGLKSHASSFYCGRVEYIPQLNLLNFIKEHPHYFISPGDNANLIRSALFKRESYSYEEEIRFIYYDIENRVAGNDYRFSIDINSVFDEIAVDPFITDSQFRRIERMIRNKGYTGNVYQSDLYKPIQLVISF